MITAVPHLPVNFLDGFLHSPSHAQPHEGQDSAYYVPYYGLGAGLRSCGLSTNRVYLFIIIIFFGLFVLFRATPTAYGGSQARGLIGPVATRLRRSHSNARSELRL